MNLYIRAGTQGAAVPGSLSGPGSVGGAEYRRYGAGADKRVTYLTARWGFGVPQGIQRASHAHSGFVHYGCIDHRRLSLHPGVTEAPASFQCQIRIPAGFFSAVKIVLYPQCCPKLLKQSEAVWFISVVHI